MDIVVLVKQTFDTEAKIELAGDAIVSDGVKKILNPYDEYAVEEAVRLKEKNGGTVTAVGIGGKEFEDVLRHVLAMGCDASVVIDDPAVLDRQHHARVFTVGGLILAVVHAVFVAAFEQAEKRPACV